MKCRGVYDEDYLAYLRALLQSMEPYGLVAYIVGAIRCTLLRQMLTVSCICLGSSSRCMVKILRRSKFLALQY